LNLNKVKKLLIIRLSSLGDILLTTPVIRAIKKDYPKIKIDFVLRKEYHDLLKLNPYIDDIFLFSNDKNETKKLNTVIQKNNYDLIIDLQNNIRSKRLLRNSNAFIKTFKKNNLKKFLLVHFKINKLKNALSITERYAQTLESLKLDKEGLDLFSDRDPVQLKGDNTKLVGLCPGAKHFTKMWSKEYFIELGMLLEQNGYRVVLFGGKDDELLCDEIKSTLPEAINLCNDNDILQTVANMKMCKTIFSNDSGLMHTVTAVKVPLIAFFGSTVREFGFTPYKSRSLVLENNNLSCRPCSHIGRSKCPKKHFKCMLDIPPQLAFNKFKSFASP
jgi:lipopolysaccharide heptosyltransferase II